MHRYHNNAEATAVHAQRWLVRLERSWVLAAGQTRLPAGPEMIICRGANYYCYEIEDSVSAVEGTLPALVLRPASMMSRRVPRSYSLLCPVKRRWCRALAPGCSPGPIEMSCQCVRSRSSLHLASHWMHRTAEPAFTGRRPARSSAARSKAFLKGDYRTARRAKLACVQPRVQTISPPL